MRGSFRRNMLDCPISESAKIQAAEERFPLAKRNWRKSQVNFVYVAGLNDKELMDMGTTRGEIDYVASNRSIDPRGVRSADI